MSSGNKHSGKLQWSKISSGDIRALYEEPLSNKLDKVIDEIKLLKSKHGDDFKYAINNAIDVLIGTITCVSGFTTFKI